MKFKAVHCKEDLDVSETLPSFSATEGQLAASHTAPRRTFRFFRRQHVCLLATVAELFWKSSLLFSCSRLQVTTCLLACNGCRAVLKELSHVQLFKAAVFSSNQCSRFLRRFCLENTNCRFSEELIVTMETLISKSIV